jgi:hypothetical protein
MFGRFPLFPKSIREQPSFAFKINNGADTPADLSTNPYVLSGGGGLSLRGFDAKQNHRSFGFGHYRVMTLAPLPFQARAGGEIVAYGIPRHPQHHQCDDPKQRLLHHELKYRKTRPSVKRGSGGVTLKVSLISAPGFLSFER